MAELNRNCSKWISKHVEESPFVILTPVFVDYFNYLILLEKSFFPDTFNNNNNNKPQTTPTTTSSKSSTLLNGDNNSSNYLNGHKEKNDFFKGLF